MEAASPARVLVVAHATAATPALLDAVRTRAAQGPAVFTLLVPASPQGLERLVGADNPDSSESDAVLALALPPLEAIQDAINVHGFDEIILSTLPVHVSRWLHIDLPHKIGGLGLPVTTVTARG